MIAKSQRRLDYPALSAFLAGYLRQDFALDHATPRGAVRAFHNDAAVADRRALAREAARFLRSMRGRPLSEIRAALAAMGAAWRPATRAAFERVMTDLQTTPAL